LAIFLATYLVYEIARWLTTGSSSVASQTPYVNLHLFGIVGFLAIARLMAPSRYPVVRTTFILAHLPALLVIGLYPPLPWRWRPC